MSIVDPRRLIEAMRAGSIIRIPDLDCTIAPTIAIAALAGERAEEELLQEMVSYREDVTGVTQTGPHPNRASSIYPGGTSLPSSCCHVQTYLSLAGGQGLWAHFGSC